MRQGFSHHNRSLLMVGAAAAVLLSASAASAQAPAANAVDEVVVTGTRIQGAAGVGSPVVAVSDEVIERTGLVSTTDVLRAFPQIANLGADESRIGAGLAQGAGANVTAATGINLRGLGTEATLVLIDGRRLPPGGQAGQLVDPNTIPMIALQRVEVVADGGSAIYGSDAVGGVVNLILKKPFNGAETSLRYATGEGLEQRQFMQLLGKTWSTGGVLFAYENNYRSNLATGDRLDLYREDFRGVGGPDLRQTFSNPGTLVAGGTSYAIPANQNGRGLTAAQLTPGTNRQRASLGGDILPEQERQTFFVTARQEIGDRLEVGVQAVDTKRSFYRYTGSGTANLTVPRSNPFFVSPIAGAPNVQVQYSYIGDYGPVYQHGSEAVRQLVLFGSLDLAREWKLSAHASTGRSIERRYNGLQVYNNRLAEALADPNPATAFNPFGAGSNTNAATLARIRAPDSLNFAEHGLDNYMLMATGPLFSMWGGQVRGAVGVERFEDTLHVYDMADRAGAGFVKTLEFDNKRTRDALFAELAIPLVGADQDIPGVRRLDLNLAARYENASDFGDTLNPKIGANWEVTEGLVVRGTYGTSFRAPTLSDVSPFATAAVQILNYVDPRSPTGQTRGIRLFGGSPDLKPETATTWSVGVDYRPPVLPGLRTSATYFNIDYQDRIDQPGQEADPLLREGLLTSVGVIQRNPSQAFLNGLYALPIFGGTPEPASAIGVFVDARKFNVGRVQTSGFDFTVDYAFENALGDWTVGAFASYTVDYKRQFVTGGATANYVNRINYPARWRARGNVGWERGIFNATAYVNWLNSYDNDLVTPAATVDGFTTVDLQVGVRTPDSAPRYLQGVRFSISAQNLFDSEPPFARNGTLAYDPQQASAVGRLVSFQLTKQW